MPICNIEREKIILNLLISIQEPQKKLVQNQQVCHLYFGEMTPQRPLHSNGIS
jgi:hypothetical protein